MAVSSAFDWWDADKNLGCSSKKTKTNTLVKSNGCVMHAAT
jgi:hypothetical protein